MFTLDEQTNIKVFEMFYDEIQKRIDLNLMKYDMLRIINNRFHSIMIDFITCKISCCQNQIKYISKIIEKNKLFFWIDISNLEKIDEHQVKLLLKSHIHAFTIYFDKKAHLNLNLKNTNIKHIDCWNVGSKVSCLINWLQKNEQICSIGVNRIHIEYLIEFIKDNPNHELKYVNVITNYEEKYLNDNVITNDLYNDELQILLKNKRRPIQEKIFVVLLIANSQHKYKQYLPKNIMKYILSLVCEVEYMKNHDKIVTYYN